MGGGFGFGLGGWIQVVGRARLPAPYLDWWKVMELHFGFCFGLALGYAAWRHRRELGREAAAATSASLWPAAVIVPLALFLSLHGQSRIAYSLVAAGLMAAALYWGSAAWHVAITMTYCAYSIDFLRNKPELDAAWLWASIAVTTAAVALLVTRWQRAHPLLLLLMWTAVANSMAKSFVPWHWHSGAAAMEAAFVLLATLCTFLASPLRLRQ